MRHRFLSLAVLGALAVSAAPARAEFNIATGLKWVPVRYTNAVGAGEDTAAPPPAGTGTIAVPGQWYKGTAGELYGNNWQTTSLDNYIGFFFTEQIGLQISLDLGWANHNTDTNIPNVGQGNFNTSYFQVGIGLGGKFYLNRPTGNRVSPYLLVNFFKYFAAVSSNDPRINNDIVGAIAAFHSPVGFDLAFGAEYFFTTSFSMGAEVLGIRFAHVDGSFPVPNTGGRTTANENYLMLYTGISLNYRFLATARVYTYEGEEDRENPRPRRAKPRPRPAEEEQAPPPPSPESVD